MSSFLRPPSGHVFRVERVLGRCGSLSTGCPMAGRCRRRSAPPGPSAGARRPATSPSASPRTGYGECSTRRDGEPAAGTVRTGATFGDAAAESLRYTEHDRGCKASTLRDYRSNLEAHLPPAFGSMKLEEITAAEIDGWRGSLTGLSPRAKNKLLVVMHGVMRRAQHVWSLRSNPVAAVEKQRQRSSGDIEVFSPEEVMALVRAATSEQDAAIYLTAAFTGLRRGELLALHWRDVDFAGSVIRVRASYAGHALTTPKSGKVRPVPMAPDVARALASLAQRQHWTGDDDRVFPREAGSYLDGSALRRRYATALAHAGLRPLRFHDLRHAFGTRMIAKADIRRVQEWMGHADVQTTMRCLHYAPRADDAALVAEAFAFEDAASRDVAR